MFASGVKLMKHHRPDLMYLSTTDYIQHKAGPGTKIANDFYVMIDRYLAALDEMGAIIVATADHGMNDKHDPVSKQPNVIYLETLIESWLGAGKVRVILPITDPYVAHHGALGSFATIHVDPTQDFKPLLARLRSTPGIELALSQEDAVKCFELPADRLGQIVVISTRHQTLGTAAHKHDLSGLDEPLRSHGGVTEQRVPMIANRHIKVPADHYLRNFDVFDVALNRIV